jgi:hypothetical protein
MKTTSITSAWRQPHQDFKSSTFDLAGDGAHDREAPDAIIFGWAYNESRPSTRLLVTFLWVEGDPDEIPASWDIPCIYQVSSPTAGPFQNSSG